MVCSGNYFWQRTRGSNLSVNIPGDSNTYISCLNDSLLEFSMLANSMFPTSIKRIFMIPFALSVFSDLNLDEKLSKYSSVNVSLVQESLVSDLLLAMWQLSL